MEIIESERLDIDLIKELLNNEQIKSFNFSLDEFLTLPISAIKDLNKNEIEILKEDFKIFSINGLYKLHFKRIIENKQIFSDINFTNKILNLKRRITEIIDIKSKIKTKITFIGLDNAGKSTIINIFKKSIKHDEISKIKPTIGMKREHLLLRNFNISILDLGGQKKYRGLYLKNPHRYFDHLSLVFYVIDIQDERRFEETLKYLREIANIIANFNKKEDCEFIVLIHKYDPEIVNDIIFEEKFEYLAEKIETILTNKFEFKIYKSSIYNLANLQNSDFLTYFNSLFTIEDSLSNQLQIVFKQIDELRQDISQLYKLVPNTGIQFKPRKIFKEPKLNPRVQLKSQLINELKGIFRLKAGKEND